MSGRVFVVVLASHAVVVICTLTCLNVCPILIFGKKNVRNQKQALENEKKKFGPIAKKHQSLSKLGIMFLRFHFLKLHLFSLCRTKFKASSLMQVSTKIPS